MADERLCKLCDKDLESEDWQYQDNGHAVHTSCRHQTFYRKGEKVVNRFWEQGTPYATVVQAHVVYGEYRLNAMSPPKVGKMEWVLVEYPDGKREEWSVGDTRVAPDWLVRQVDTTG